MPIHFNDLDIASELAETSSALIVACNMCPAATVAVRENKPFMQLFRSFFKSPPFEQYLKELQAKLKDQGVNSNIFRNNIYHQWFLCMWTSSLRKKLEKDAEHYGAVIVLGCESATVTVRDSVKSTGCKVIEGMEATGIVNATLKFRWPCNIFFEDSKIVPLIR